MKTVNLLTIISFLTFLAVPGLMAQDDYFELSPAEMTPDEDGYYRAGVDVDEDDNGELEHHEGCEDYYSDSHHFETDVQQGFTYQNVMIMPDCWPKNAVEDDGASSNVAQGYMELGKSRYPGTDSAKLCYVISPSIKNLTKMELEVSPDVTPHDSRSIDFDIEYSTDGGTTWSGDEDTYIRDQATSKEGELITYDADNVDFGVIWNVFMQASESNSIVIRIMSRPESEALGYSPQRVKIHNLKIYAEEGEVTAVDVIYANTPSFKIVEQTIYAEEGNIQVFNTLGQSIGSGESVVVPERGIYIVRTKNGNIHKILIK